MCVYFRVLEKNSGQFSSFSFQFAALLCQQTQTKEIHKERFPFGLNANIWISKKWRDSPVQVCFLSVSFLRDPILFPDFNLPPPLMKLPCHLELSTFYLFFPKLPVSYRLHIWAFPQLISCVSFIFGFFEGLFQPRHSQDTCYSILFFSVCLHPIGCIFRHFRIQLVAFLLI